MKHCDFYIFETLRNVFKKYSGRCFYQTLRNVSNIKKFQCFNETSNSSISEKDLAIFRGKTMFNFFFKKCLTQIFVVFINDFYSTFFEGKFLAYMIAWCPKNSLLL